MKEVLPFIGSPIPLIATIAVPFIAVSLAVSLLADPD